MKNPGRSQTRGKTKPWDDANGSARQGQDQSWCQCRRLQPRCWKYGAASAGHGTGTRRVPGTLLPAPSQGMPSFKLCWSQEPHPWGFYPLAKSPSSLNQRVQPRNSNSHWAAECGKRLLNFLYHKARTRHQEKLECVIENCKNILISIFQEQTGQTQQGKAAPTKWSSSTTTSARLVAVSQGLRPPRCLWFAMGPVWFGIAPQ